MLEMPTQLMLTMLSESALITLTMILLVQPRLIFRTQSTRLKRAAMISGWAVLCLTFCWSVILGCVLTLSRLSFRL